MPNHNHDELSGVSGSQPLYAGNSTGGDFGGLVVNNTNNNSTSYHSKIITNSTGSNHAHSHGVTTSAHTHSLAVSSFDNRSSFKALYKIMRLA